MGSIEPFKSNYNQWKHRCSDSDSLSLRSKVFATERKFAGIACELLRWQINGWSPILFGGFLRDPMIFGFSRWPRDIDIVMTLQSTERVGKGTFRKHAPAGI